MSVTSIPVAAFRYTADGAQAIAETVRIRSAVEQLNQSDLADLSKSFLGLDLTLESVASSAAGLVSAGGLAALIKQGADFVNEISDAAERAGTTANSLSKLRFAAEESDVSFESLTSGIRKFQDGLSQAAIGQGQVAGSLSEIGLSVQKLRGLALEDQLGLIADGFEQLGDQTDRVRISNDLFGRSSSELIGLLAQGREGIKGLTDQAEDLGLALDNRATAAVDRGTKAIERLGKVAVGVFATIAQQIALTLGDSGDAVLETEAKLAELERRRNVNLKENNDTARNKAKQLQAEIEAQNEILRILQAQKAAKDFVASGSQLKEVETTARFVPFVRAPKTQEQKLAEDEASRAEQFANLMTEQRGDLEREFAENQKKLASEVSDNLEDEVKRRNEIEQNGRDRIVQQEQAYQDQILAIRRQGVSAAQVLLTAYGGKFAAVGKAILLVEKALAIKATFINTREAIMKTFAKYGGTPIGYASAAAIAVLGAAQIAAIAAQGTSGGGGATSGGNIGSAQRDTAPGFDPVTDPTQPFVNQSQPTVAQIIIQGSVFSSRETADFLIQQIRDAVDKRDVVIIGNDSRQMQEIRR